MADAALRVVDEAIQRISSSDPIIKLLHEVKLGRMRPTDAGLRAITESWIETYRQAIVNVKGVDRSSVLKLDPRPRLEILTEAGVLAPDHPGAMALRSAFDQMLDSVSGSA